MASERIKTPHEFHCLTDSYIRGVDRVLFKQYWPGWWSKLEMFWYQAQLGEPVLFLDLDTALVGDIELTEPQDREVFLLRDLMAYGDVRYKSRWWATGLMAWNVDLSFIYDHALHLGIEHVRNYYQWDQIFVGKCLQEADTFSVRAIDDTMTVQSYKVHGLHCKSPGKDTQIVCFHGQPRPWDVETPWVKELWHGMARN